MFKIKTVILALLFGFLTWIFLPLFFITLNDYFHFLIIQNIFLKLIGIVLIIIGITAVIYLIFIFKILGNGTPVPIEPTKKLIVKGLYKYSRNPLYISHLTILLGIALFFGRITLFIYCLLVFLVFNAIIIYWEEPQLKKRFGKEYLNYMRKVPRWI